MMVLLLDYDGFTYDYLAAVLYWFYSMIMMVLLMIIWRLYYNGFTP